MRALDTDPAAAMAAMGDEIGASWDGSAPKEFAGLLDAKTDDVA